MYGEIFAPQGWQCPVCKRVYSPTTPMCFYCGTGEVTTSTSTKVIIGDTHPKTDTSRRTDNDK